MAVQLKISGVKPINGSNLANVVELTNFNFATLKSALTEFLTSINYSQDTGISVDIQAISADTISSREGISVLGSQLPGGGYPEVIRLDPSGAITAKNTVVEDVLEGKRLRLRIFGALPPTGVPGEIVYIAAQGARIEGFYGYLVSTGWTLLSGGGGEGCKTWVTRSVTPDTVTGVDVISVGLTPMPSPVSTSPYFVYINGVETLVGNGDISAPAYFSKDGGVTATGYGFVDSTDELYWNATAAGYGLDSGDTVTMMYQTADPYCGSPGVYCSTNIVGVGETNSAYTNFGVEVIFDTAAGSTSPLTICAVPAPTNNSTASLPGGYLLTNTLLAYEISTPLASGAIIRFTAPAGTTLSEFNDIRIFHEVNGSYVDETILSGPYAPDFGTLSIYAQVTSFSPFFMIPYVEVPTTTTTSTTTTTTLPPTTTTTSTSTTTTTTAASTTTTTTLYCSQFAVTATRVAEDTISFNLSGPRGTQYVIEQYGLPIVAGTIPTTINEVIGAGDIRVTIDTCTFCFRFNRTTQAITQISCTEYDPSVPTTTTSTSTTTTSSTTTTTTAASTTTTTTLPCGQYTVTVVRIAENVLNFRLTGPADTSYTIEQFGSLLEAGVTPNIINLPIADGDVKVTINGCTYCYRFVQRTQVVTSINCADYIGETTTTTTAPTTTTTTSSTTTTTTAASTTTTTTQYCDQFEVVTRYADYNVYAFTINGPRGVDWELKLNGELANANITPITFNQNLANGIVTLTIGSGDNLCTYCYTFDEGSQILTRVPC